ncbi:MAG: hypothetical protein ACRCY8_13500 [Dermatophilaceae bacterium]
MARRAQEQASLIPMPTAPPGPVYQGVAAQFRALFPKGDASAQQRKAELAGWLRLALAHARAIDATPGATVGRAQTSAELRETLNQISEAVGTQDAFDALSASLLDG